MKTTEVNTTNIGKDWVKRVIVDKYIELMTNNHFISPLESMVMKSVMNNPHSYISGLTLVTGKSYPTIKQLYAHQDNEFTIDTNSNKGPEAKNRNPEPRHTYFMVYFDRNKRTNRHWDRSCFLKYERDNKKSMKLRQHRVFLPDFISEHLKMLKRSDDNPDISSLPLSYQKDCEEKFINFVETEINIPAFITNFFEMHGTKIPLYLNTGFVTHFMKEKFKRLYDRANDGYQEMGGDVHHVYPNMICPGVMVTFQATAPFFRIKEDVATWQPDIENNVWDKIRASKEVIDFIDNNSSVDDQQLIANMFNKEGEECRKKFYDEWVPWYFANMNMKENEKKNQMQVCREHSVFDKENQRVWSAVVKDVRFGNDQIIDMIFTLLGINPVVSKSTTHLFAQYIEWGEDHEALKVLTKDISSIGSNIDRHLGEMVLDYQEDPSDYQIKIISNEL
jgi:hypothetical protein